MSKLVALIKYEYKVLKVQQKIDINLFWMLIISGISLPMILPLEALSKMAPLFVIVYLPGAIFSICSNFFKADVEDGSLDFALLTNTTFNIVMAKFLNVCFFCLSVILLCAPLFGLLFDLSLKDIGILVYCSCVVSFQAAGLCLLASSVEIYFHKSQTTIASLLIPLLIPEIIICGTIMEQADSGLMLVAIGLLILTSIPTIFFSSLLLRNRYS